MSESKYFDRVSIPHLYCDISVELNNYRKWFLMRKNVLGYKLTNCETPEILNKLINSFDRKIKGIPIFNDEVKKQYLEGINYIFAKYYTDDYSNKKSKYDYFLQYKCDQYELARLKNKKFDWSKGITFKEFKETGLLIEYKKNDKQ